MSTKVYLAFDERMTLHKPIFHDDWESQIVENPNRVSAIYRKLLMMESDGFKRFWEIPCVPAAREVIELCHSPEHYNFLEATSRMSDDELFYESIPDDLYFCNNTFLAARLACGGVVECVDAVTDESKSRRSKRAIAIVRPPGHHASREKASGFCYFNNVAVAAKYATNSGKANKVFIIDWDIHHGNGIQDLTYDDPQIFYLSIHRSIYPWTGKPKEVGNGMNLNISFSKPGMGDAEYAACFSDVVLPLMNQFKPDIVFIACGLDPVKGDLLGDCGLSPEMFYTMTRSVLEADSVVACDIPVVVALEGGYNVEQSADCMEYVAMAMLDEPIKKEDRLVKAWSCKSIMPQRPKIKESNEETRKLHALSSNANKSAIKSIKRSTTALERQGGTCMCGCHYRCHHVLPLKKRKHFRCSTDDLVEEQI